MKFSKWASLATARSRLKSSMAEESGAICFQHSTPTSRAWSQMKPNVLTSGLSKFQRAQAPSSRARSQMNSTELTSSLGTIRRAQAQSFESSVSNEFDRADLQPQNIPESSIRYEEKRNCEDADVHESIVGKLRSWALDTATPHRALTELLKILQTHSCFASIPGSARSLLKTPRKACVEKMGAGKYCHFGVKEGLDDTLKRARFVPDVIKINVNIDGLPLTKSTRDQFWPVLCHVTNCGKCDPFPIGVYYGKSKAVCAEEFLRPAVSDIIEALSDGLIFKGRHLRIELSALICDAPAKSYVLGIKGHNGYFSCTKCQTEDDKKFGVVKFVGDNTVAVIHLNWVDGADCFWPAATHKNLGALTLEGAQPQPDWKKSRFASLGWYDTYQKARSKLPTAELTSDLCSDVEMGRGRRKKAKRILYSETESEGEETYQPPKPPTPPCFKPTTKSVRCRRKVPQVRERTYKPSGKRAHGTAMNLVESCHLSTVQHPVIPLNSGHMAVAVSLVESCHLDTVQQPTIPLKSGHMAVAASLVESCQLGAVQQPVIPLKSGHMLRASSGDPEDVASQARGPVFAVPALASAEEASARSKEARIKEGETWANNVETRASEPQTGAEARANKVKAWANEAEARAGPPRLKPAWSRLRPGPTCLGDAEARAAEARAEEVELRASSGDPEDVASQARGPVFAVPALASAEEASARSKEARIKEGETWANNVETRASEPQTGAEARANKVKAWANEAEARAGPPRLKPAWSRLRPGPT
ncbi:hypothetical protein ISCGN_003268 [Ixodes scapularis]